MVKLSKKMGAIKPPLHGEKMTIANPLFTTTTYLISVLDNKTGKIREPFCMPTKQDAIRSFQTQCLKPESDFKLYPLDFELICLGTYSDNGTIDTYPIRETLATAAQFSAN